MYLHLLSICIKYIRHFFLNQDTWRFLYEDKGDIAKVAQLGKVSGIHRTFRNKLVAFVRLDMLPFDTYKYMPQNLEHWEMFVAYTTSEDFLVCCHFILLRLCFLLFMTMLSIFILYVTWFNL